jgi:hypothetical protein
MSTVVRASKLTNWKVATHVMQPAEFPPGRICLHVTLKVNVIPFLDIIWIEGASQHQRDDWWNWGGKENDNSVEKFEFYRCIRTEWPTHALEIWHAMLRVLGFYKCILLSFFFPSFLPFRLPYRRKQFEKTRVLINKLSFLCFSGVTTHCGCIFTAR